MKGSVSTSELRRALALCASVVERRNTIEIIGNVKLSLDAPSSLVMTVTDLNCELRVDIEAEVTEAGQITVPAHILFEAARALPDGSVAINMDMAAARFSSGSAQFDLPVMPVSDFPSLEARGEWSSATMPASSLKTILDHVVPFIHRESAHYMLTGAYFHAVSGTFRVASSDRLRVAFAELGPAGSLEAVQAIVPSKAVAILIRLLDGAGEVELSFNEGAVRLVGAGHTFMSRLVAGQYPDYQRTIPRDFTCELSAPRASLLSASRRVALISDEKSPGLKVEMSRRGADLSARRNMTFGFAKDHVDGAYSGDDITVGVNARYFAEALGVYDSEAVAFRTSQGSPVVGIFDPNDAGRAVVMGTMRV